MSTRYFRRLDAILAAMKAHEYVVATRLSYESLPLVPGLIEQERRERGSFQLTGIPCIEIAARFSSAQGDLARLEELRVWTESLVDLAPWLSVIDERIERAKFQPRILAIVRNNPGAHQNALAKVLGADGRMVGRLVTDMENLGLLSRIPDGKTNALYLPNDVPTKKLAEKTSRPSRETRRRPVPTVVRPRRIVVQDPTDTWIAIDFETATSNPNSACALGVAVLQHGEIASTGAWLIKPPAMCTIARTLLSTG